MIFHTDAFYLRLKAELYSENNDAIHNEMLEDLRPEAMKLAYKFFRSPEDAEDAAQIACMTFYRRGVHAFMKEENLDEEGRKRWVLRALKNAVTDHYRKVRSRSGVSAVVDGERTYARHSSIDAETEDGTPIGTMIDSGELSPEEKFMQRFEVIEAFRSLFAMDNINESKLIVTAFAMLMQNYGYTVNDKKFNEYIARKIGGQTIAFTLAQIRGLLKKLNIPLSVVRPLEIRIREVTPDGLTVGDQMIDVSTRGVTQQTSDMRTRMRKLDAEQEERSNVVAFRSPYRKE